MTKQNILTFTALFFSALLLSNCGGLRSSLGLDNDGPDEFAVITRAPLEMPAKLALPPPNPGVQRPQEKPTIVEARETVFGEQEKSYNPASSATEARLLDKAGAGSAQEDIRNVVNQETHDLKTKNLPVAKKLLKLTGQNGGASGVIVDAEQEFERIKKNKTEGKSILDGETPVIE